MTRHPAKFSDPILDVIAAELPPEGVILDPFAGIGRIHELATDTRTTIGIEIEPEWAATHEDTICGDALDLAASGIGPESVDAVATSPTYGNRLADSHNAQDGSVRRSYTHDIGHRLHVNNSGAMQWGDEYRAFHVKAYTQAIAALKPGGTFVLNVSDHIRAGVPQGVHIWHVVALTSLGLTWVRSVPVATRRMRYGANASARVAEEWVLVFVRGSVAV